MQATGASTLQWCGTPQGPQAQTAKGVRTVKGNRRGTSQCRIALSGWGLSRAHGRTYTPPPPAIAGERGGHAPCRRLVVRGSEDAWPRRAGPPRRPGTRSPFPGRAPGAPLPRRVPVPCPGLGLVTDGPGQPHTNGGALASRE